MNYYCNRCLIGIVDGIVFNQKIYCNNCIAVIANYHKLKEINQYYPFRNPTDIITAIESQISPIVRYRFFCDKCLQLKEDVQWKDNPDNPYGPYFYCSDCKNAEVGSCCIIC